MHRVKRSSWATVTIVGTVALLVSVPMSRSQAQAQSQAQSKDVVSTVVNRSAVEIAAFWTPERMAAAKPLDVSVAGGKSIADPSTAGPTGSAGLAAGGAPGGKAAFQNIKDLLARPAASPIPAEGTYPGPNNTYEYVPEYQTYPISTVGKLFFMIPGSGSFVCSATAVSATSIWTAGHCLASGTGVWYTNWIFCPSYKDGVNPNVGCWTSTAAQTTGAWFNNGAFSRDVGVVTLESCTAGSGYCRLNGYVGDNVGWLGFAWNWGRDQHWFHYGYPAASPWSGERIIATAAEHRYDVVSDGYGPATNSWGSTQTPGSSGSAVLLFFSYSGAYINSNVSYYFGNEYGIELQGPYFDSEICSFYNVALGRTLTC